MSLKDDKAKLFNSKTYRGPVEELDIEGVELEIRAPKVRHTIKGLSKKGEKIKMQNNADFRELLLDCVYHKASGQPFFTHEDLEALENSAGHDQGILARIGDAIQSLSKSIAETSDEDSAKNF